MKNNKHVESFVQFNEILNLSDVMYSKKLNYFQPVDIKLLRSIDEICKEYDGVGIEPDYMDDSNIESGEICQLNKYPDGSYSVGYFNERGNGTGYYTIRGNRKFVENYDFVFI